MSDLIEFACTNCGNKHIKRPADAHDEDEVSCAGCGATTTYGALKASMREQAVDEVKKSVRDIFNRRKR